MRKSLNLFILTDDCMAATRAVSLSCKLSISARFSSSCWLPSSSFDCQNGEEQKKIKLNLGKFNFICVHFGRKGYKKGTQERHPQREQLDLQICRLSPTTILFSSLMHVFSFFCRASLFVLDSSRISSSWNSISCSRSAMLSCMDKRRFSLRSSWCSVSKCRTDLSI